MKIATYNVNGIDARLPRLQRLGVTGVITNDAELFARAGVVPAG